MARFVPSRCAAVVTACAAAWGAAGIAQGTTLISIGDGQPVSWSQALGSDMITPAGELTSVAVQFYTESIASNPSMGFDSFEGVPVRLNNMTVPDVRGRTFDSLVMSWDAPEGNGGISVQQVGANPLGVAGWDLNLPQGTDLRGYDLHFSLLPPPGIWDVSLELIDANGRARGWFMPMPPNPGEWQEHWIWLNKDMPQGPFTFFYTDAEFDLSNVVAIRLDEAGNSVTINDPTTGLPGVWNAWNHVTIKHTPIIPEPFSATLAMMGLGALALRTSRRG